MKRAKSRAAVLNSLHRKYSANSSNAAAAAAAAASTIVAKSTITPASQSAALNSSTVARVPVDAMRTATSTRAGGSSAFDAAVECITACVKTAPGAARSSSLASLKMEKFYRDNLRGKAINTGATKKQIQSMKQSHRTSFK